MGIAIPLPAPPSTCVGDCDATVSELIALVNIARGSAPLLDCEAADANHDGHVTVDEILTMVKVTLGNAPLLNCEAADANHDSNVTIGLSN
ncbi:MAG: hypothetical protein ACHQ9S_22125 [Candidatus Binatia bacterium]